MPFRCTWRAHFSRVVESVLDVSHLPFVHPETTGRNVPPVVEGPSFGVENGDIWIHPTPFAPVHPMEPLPYPQDTAGAGAGRGTEIELLFPNQWIIRTPMEDGLFMCTFLTFTPTDDEHTDIFGLAMRNFDFTAPLLDAFHLEHTRFVMEQDEVVVESQRPRVAPQPQAEAHVASDAPTLRYRKLLQRAWAGEQRSSQPVPPPHTLEEAPDKGE
nr:hypothetical protein [Alicyclobacillus shizuokensis]